MWDIKQPQENAWLACDTHQTEWLQSSEVVLHEWWEQTCMARLPQLSDKRNMQVHFPFAANSSQLLLSVCHSWYIFFIFKDLTLFTLCEAKHILKIKYCYFFIRISDNLQVSVHHHLRLIGLYSRRKQFLNWDFVYDTT